MKYYKFYKSTYFKKIVNKLTYEQITEVYISGYPMDGLIFIPCEFVSDEFYKECKDFEDKLNPYK